MAGTKPADIYSDADICILALSEVAPPALWHRFKSRLSEATTAAACLGKLNCFTLMQRDVQQTDEMCIVTSRCKPCL